MLQYLFFRYSLFQTSTAQDIGGQSCQLLKGMYTVVEIYCQHLHAMIFPYLFFIRFSSFLAESHGADCPSKKL